MRVLLLLRGSAGCGKSTWIERNGLKPYTLSADDIRLLCQSPVQQVDGTKGISQSNDKIVWKTLFNLLETRMQRGDFTVIDATNSKTVEMNRYKDMCNTYRYRIFCVDFTNIPIDEVKRRNANRDPLKVVPEEAIDKMYSRFATQKIPSGITVIKPNELDKIWMKLFDLSDYKKIHHIGDIHGCNTALQEYFNSNGGFKEDEFYIFTGDYIDRGIENADVIQFLLEIKDKKNVLMLEGNHERWLWLWGNDCPSKSKEFELFTRRQLEDARISKKDVRQLYRKFGQCAYYKYCNNVYLVTHAGLSTMPDNLTTVATEQMIRGVGNYNDFEKIADTWLKTTDDNLYQIHGHRNTKLVLVKVNDRVFNLEGRVEFGGCLRVVQVDKNGIHPIEIKNNVFKQQEEIEDKNESSISIGDLIVELRNNRFIQEKQFGNISSFNFTKQAFYDKVWNEQTTKARGLYLDTLKARIVARAYEKFFNINERPETKFDMLQNKLKFPVSAYVKENGFLGIVGYDEYSDELFITSKSSPDGCFSEWLREMFYSKVTKDNAQKIKEYIKENNVSFVFECVDMKNDPHIIEYKESKLVLLDIVYNKMEFEKYDFNTMCDIANMFGLKHKELAYEIANWQEFFDWYYDVLAEDYEWNGSKIEGFVIEDSNGYMTKLKLSYYNFWKYMRSISHEAIRNGYIRRTSSLTSPLANDYYAWVRKLHDWENKEEIPKDICTLRSMYYKDKLGK